MAVGEIDFSVPPDSRQVFDSEGVPYGVDCPRLPFTRGITVVACRVGTIRPEVPYCSRVRVSNFKGQFLVL
jgi:hypothetical protein